ncbi:MAG: hypothetical protein JWM56_747 [Candidatus Peribacteria bacterium]|nr:hypothetical protein [Candidatus Peribacteria bacterium]
MTTKEVLAVLHSHANPDNVKGMARFGVKGKQLMGISIPVLRALARKTGKDHALAQGLWQSGFHEARILAGMIEDPLRVTGQQMDSWVAGFDSWDVCDQVCGNVFDRTPFAYAKAAEWAASEVEYTRRAGFALMAALAVHDKKSTDTKFVQFFPLIKKYAHDDRNFVKKAVNWALRQIGKRSASLHPLAMAVAQELVVMDSRSAKWIGRDAIRELQSDAVKKRLKNH